MKNIILAVALITSLFANAQDAEQTVNVVSSGQGKTIEEAKNNALKYAILQVFGIFISSKTEILKDSLIINEIISKNNGNIKSFEILSSIILPNKNTSINIKANISITKLKSLCESFGVAIEFSGNLFSTKIKQQLLNEEAEYIAIQNLCYESFQLIYKSVDYSIEIGENPKLINKDQQTYYLPILVSASSNNNKKIFFDYFKETISKLSITDVELDVYKKTNIPVYEVGFLDTNTFKDYRNNRNNSDYNHDYKPNYIPIYLRNKKSIRALKNLIAISNLSYFYFSIQSNIDTISISSKFGLGRSDYRVHFDIDTNSINKFWMGVNYLKDDQYCCESRSSNWQSMLEVGDDGQWNSNPLSMSEKIVDEMLNGTDVLNDTLWESNLAELYFWENPRKASREDNEDEWYSVEALLKPLLICDLKKSTLDFYIMRKYHLNELAKLQDLKVVPTYN